VFGVFPGVSVCFAQCMGVGGSINKCYVIV